MSELNFLKVADYHMHTPRCNHAVGSMREYALAACAAGLPEIGFSDHSPMPDGFDKAWRMDESELDSYLHELQATQHEFKGQLVIKSALEVDYYPGAEAYIEYLAGLFDWDYLMGSVHFIGSWGFDNPDEIGHWHHCDIEQVYCDYFKVVEQSVSSGLFDTIGHPDLVKKFGFRVQGESEKIEEAEDALLTAVKKEGIAIEVSSAGLRKPVAEIYPHPRIIAKAGALHIPFSYGSDAHSPVEVGHGMHDCLALLHQNGISDIAEFTRRQRTMRSFVGSML